MAQYQTGDGRWLVGDVTGESSYHGFLGWRDCVIQLTGEGATEQSVHYLEALRDYALAHNPLGEPIMPPSINVWISNNGTTTAVQADDLSIDGDKFTIGGIVWDGSTWDYSDAGKASGGGSGGGPGYTVTEEKVIIIPEQTVETAQQDGGSGAHAVVALSDGVTTDPASMTVLYNGTEYSLDGVVFRGLMTYGDLPTALDNLRFSILMSAERHMATVVTATAQTVTIKAEAVTKTVTPSEDFKEAVEEASGGGSGGGLVVTFANSGQGLSADKTYADIVSAVKSGSPVFGVLIVRGAVRSQLIFSAFTDHIGAVFHGFDTSASGELGVISMIVKEDGTVSSKSMVLPATT